MSQTNNSNLEKLLQATVASVVIVPLAVLYSIECLRDWESAGGTFADLVLAIIAGVAAILAVLPAFELFGYLVRQLRIRFKWQIARMAKPKEPFDLAAIRLLVFVEEVAIVGIVGLIYLTAQRNGETIRSILQVVIAATITMQLLPAAHLLRRRWHRLVGQILVTAGVAVVALWIAVAACTTIDVLNFRNASSPELTTLTVAVAGGSCVAGGLVQMLRIYLADRQRRLTMTSDSLQQAGQQQRQR